MSQQVEVQCFGILQQICGARQREVAVAALPATVADVLEGLVKDVPQARACLDQTACAVGNRIVQRDACLQAGETLVLLPPVSGG